MSDWADEKARALMWPVHATEEELSRIAAAFREVAAEAASSSAVKRLAEHAAGGEIHAAFYPGIDDAVAKIQKASESRGAKRERERLRGVASKQPDGHNAAMAVLADLLIAEDQTPTDAQRAYGELVADRLEQGAHRKEAGR